MKKRIFAAILSIMAMTSAGAAAVYADEALSKEEIISEIWDDTWFGDSDDGTQFPEASFNHHLIEDWVNINYGNNDAYDWSDIGELKYRYGKYYSDLTDDWLYTDEDGQWYITDSENDEVYHFKLFQGEWSMIDSTGNTVDTFKPFSTLEEENVHHPVSADDDTSDQPGKVIPGNENAAHQKASEWTADKADSIVTGTVAAETAGVVTGTVKENEPDTTSSRKMTVYRIMAAVITVTGGALIIKTIKDGRKDS